MKDFFKNLLSEDDWLIKEKNWERRLQGVRESLFTLGNGYLGSRGVLEEIPYDANQGTYIAGLYDKAGAQVTELVNLPNPIKFKIVVQGEKVDVVAMDVLSQERTLDMKKGLLKRKALFKNSKRQRFDYQSLRFFSKDDPHLGIMRIYFTPLDSGADILVESSIDASVTNKGILSEGRKEHFGITKLTSFKDINYLCVETFESKVSVGYAALLKVKKGGKSFTTHKRSFHLKLGKGETVCFTKILSIYTSKEVKNVEKKAINSLRKSVVIGFDGLLNKHFKAWERSWDFSDISIKPDKNIQKVLRFNLYHLLISGNEFNDRVSIGARTLSGEGYRGHIFWDAEIFILPFFVYTNPVVAKNMLLYRFRILDEARMNARVEGYKGALFAWESADSGFEVTPKWSRDLDGRVIKIHTGEMEDHIVGDIAYAVCQYYEATDDRQFMLKAGLELLFETARFWASRGQFSRDKSVYHLKHVIGPDEFHVNVDDNAYTNVLAGFNLANAVRFYRQNKRESRRVFRKLIKKINLSEKEVRDWEKIAGSIAISRDEKNNVIESFCGYFQKKYVPIKNLDHNFMPLLPKTVNLKDIGQTQFVKQADVVMLLHLFPEDYSFEEKRDNFLYYNKRTLHESSLSPSIYAAVGWDTGNYHKAMHYFHYALYTDLKNYCGNTQEGIHAACLGGIWQAVIYGFAGVRATGDVISFNPHLPSEIESMKFKLRYRGGFFSISLRKNNFEILPRFKKRGKIKVKVWDKIYMLLSNKGYVFKQSPRGG